MSVSRAAGTAWVTRREEITHRTTGTSTGRPCGGYTCRRNGGNSCMFRPCTSPWRPEGASNWPCRRQLCGGRRSPPRLPSLLQSGRPSLPRVMRRSVRGALSLMSWTSPRFADPGFDRRTLSGSTRAPTRPTHTEPTLRPGTATKVPFLALLSTIAGIVAYLVLPAILGAARRASRG